MKVQAITPDEVALAANTQGRRGDLSNPANLKVNDPDVGKRLRQIDSRLCNVHSFLTEAIWIRSIPLPGDIFEVFEDAEEKFECLRNKLVQLAGEFENLGPIDMKAKEPELQKRLKQIHSGLNEVHTVLKALCALRHSLPEDLSDKVSGSENKLRAELVQLGRELK